MPGLGVSKWASEPADDACTQANTNNSNRTDPDSKHVSVPSFGYSAPTSFMTKMTPSLSAAKPPTSAEFASKAAAKRMDQFQDGSYARRGHITPNGAFTKPTLYQQQDHRTLTQGQSSTALAAVGPRGDHSAATIGRAEEARLHKLFSQWVPHAEDFYATYNTLNLDDEDVVAIQKAIVEYKVQTTIAAGKDTTYTAPWETPPSYMSHSKYVSKPVMGSAQSEESVEDTDQMEFDPTDPFRLGIISSSASRGKSRASDAMDLMD